MKPPTVPSTIKIGAHQYRILRKTKAELKGNLGECDFDNITISLRHHLRKNKLQEILLHEILHACTYPHLVGHKSIADELFVESVAPVLTQVLQDNPGLISFLTYR